MTYRRPLEHDNAYRGPACPRCSALLDPDAVFCEECGARLHLEREDVHEQMELIPLT